MEDYGFMGFTKALAPCLTGWWVMLYCIILTFIGTYFYKKYNHARSVLNCLPGLFTSLGLLGTFVAICNSLGDINEDNLEIDTIIRNLVPAFTSSIAGLISSLCVTAYTKWRFANDDYKAEGKMQNKTPEECLYETTVSLSAIQLSLEKLSNQVSEQDKNNKEYNDRLNTTISQQSAILEKFVNDFVKRMDDIFTKMHGQIEQNIKDFGEQQFKRCADTLETLTTKMSSLSTGLLEEQKSNVQQMIEGTNAELRTVSGNVTEQIGQLCKDMTDALNTLKTSQDERLTSIMSNYAALSERLANQNSSFAEQMNTQMNEEFTKMQQHNSDSLQQMADLKDHVYSQNAALIERVNSEINGQIERIQQSNVESLQQMVDLKDAYKEVNNEMLQSVTNMNQETTSELRSSLTGFISELQRNIADEVAVLSRAIETNVQSLEKSYGYISEHVAHIKGNYESASHAFEDAVNNAHRMNESQEKVLDAVNESMTEVVKTNKKVDEVINVLEERQERIEDLIAHINEMSSAIEMLQKLESQLNRIVSK